VTEPPLGDPTIPVRGSTEKLVRPFPRTSAVVTTYDARHALADPAAFVRNAWRDLVRSLAISWALHRAGFGSRRRAALFGWLWLIVPPFIAAATCLYFQSRRVLNGGETQLPYALHVFVGVVVWQLLVDALQSPMQQIRGARQVVTRSMLPHEALLLAGLWDVLLSAAIRLPLIVGAALVSGVHPGWSVLLIPAGLAAVIGFGFALGLLIAPLGLLFDDVQRATFLATGLWFILTPVMYSALPSPRFWLNPLTPLLETTRGWLLAPAIAPGFWIVLGASALLLPIAWLAYRMARPHLVETLG